MAQDRDRINTILIEEEMRNSYIDYSMSVIVARALPDVRDGLKPVHRRVLYGMLDLGLRPGSAYKKSARIVGEVLGKYHPHGDTAVYDAMVRMVQDFSLRYPLVDGQGNFGSVDGDSPAAMRYTEAKLQAIAEEVLKDIEKDTVDFVLNFDDSLKEPAVLPSLLPTLLINGAAGIAVGMATNIPPHNLNEVIDALTALINNPKLKSSSLGKYIQGPDFPTGGLVIGRQEIKSYFETGRGKLTVRAKIHIEDMKGMRERIIITEIPFQVNKKTLIEKIAALVRDKKVEGISEIRDESDREGMRVVIELRKDINAQKIVKFLYKHTQLQTTFGVILLALVDGQPKVLNIKDMLWEFIKFRHDVVLRRIKFDLDKAEKRAHILEGLLIALDNIDEVIAIIKKSRSVDTARTNLMKRFKLSEIQAQAILDMRLQRLTGLERKKIEDEYKQLLKLIKMLKALLASKPKRMQLVKEELIALKEKYGDPRRTQIIDKSKESAKNFLKEEKVIVTVTFSGLLKKHTFAEYENDKSILKGKTSKDFVKYSFVSTNSHYFLFFSNYGLCHILRTSYIPFTNSNDSSSSVTRLLHLEKGEKVIGIFEVEKFDQNSYFTLVTLGGQVKRLALATLAKISGAGQSVISLKDKDPVVDVIATNGEQDLLISTAKGFAIRFSEQDVRDMGLAAGGIRGVNLAEDDFVSGIIGIKSKKSTLLSVTNLGFGKRSDLAEYSRIHRGGRGIINFKTSSKTGFVVAILEVNEKDELYFITLKGKVKRQKAKFIQIKGRATQGSVVANIAKADEIESVIYAPRLSTK